MIYIMRHGQTDSNKGFRLACRESGELTNRGREQAWLAADWLKDKDITALYCSPYPRAVDTAKIVGKVLQLEPKILDGVQEIDCGSLNDLDTQESREQFIDTFGRMLERDFEAEFPDGENLRIAHNRFRHALQAVESDENPLIVSHGAVTRASVPLMCVNAAALAGVRMLTNTGFCLLEPYFHGAYACQAWDLHVHLDAAP